jgi:hypothetical protein
MSDASTTDVLFTTANLTKDTSSAFDKQSATDATSTTACNDEERESFDFGERHKLKSPTEDFSDDNSSLATGIEDVLSEEEEICDVARNIRKKQAKLRTRPPGEERSPLRRLPSGRSCGSSSAGENAKSFFSKFGSEFRSNSSSFSSVDGTSNHIISFQQAADIINAGQLRGIHAQAH